jgi:cytochrome c-type biogenesis protein CcmH/NrfF
MRRRATAALLAATLIAATGATAAAASAGATRASLTDIEQDVMCVVCKTPLAVSQSPEADRERAFISKRIARGEAKSQIEHQLVGQYGPSVLALPPASGFNLTVYILPPAVVLIGAGLLAYTLPKWRRRTPKAPAAGPATPDLTPSDAQRLNDELARFGR